MNNVKFNFPKVPFKLTNTPIDYFKLEKDLFVKDGFNYTKEEIRFNNKTPYLEGGAHFSNLDIEKKETIVFNFQVGKGKSSILGLTVAEYYAEGYSILICSPYIKLIEKEIQTVLDLFHKNTKRSKFAELLNWPVEEYSLGRDKVFFTHDYSMVNPLVDLFESDIAVADRPIHLLTINNLLGNPGENRLYQSGYKQRYIDKLLTLWKDEKVVFFFDEIHESTETFKSIFLPNLFRWQGIVSKIFISSATFTASSVPIIKALGSLTDKNITIYESERKKNSVQSNLSLHIMPSVYGYKTKYFLNHLGSIIKAYQEKEVPVNIITSSKILAENVAEMFFENKVIKENSDLKDTPSLDYINLCTADTELKFNDTQNNIGTTFKTGVNLANPNSVLVIIFPSIFSDSTYNNYGIFSDGVQSIIQTIGRMRNGGDIHLVISNPKSLIEYDYPDIIKGFTNAYEYLNQNRSYEEVVKAYKERFEKLESSVLEMEENIRKISLLDATMKNNFGFWYPNIHEFLIEYSQLILLNHKNPSFGREISPYVLWACLNNQFANATLKNIYHLGSKQTMNISAKNAKEVFKEIYATKQEELFKHSFRHLVNNLGELLNTTGEGNSSIPIKYLMNDKSLTSAVLINRYPSIVLAAIDELFQFKFGLKFPITQDDYIRLCLNDVSLNRNNNSSELDTLQEQYLHLYQYSIEFSKWISSFLSTDKKYYNFKADLFENLETDFVSRVKDCLLSIQSQDFMFSSKAISFLQGLGELKDSDLKGKVFNFLLKLSYEIIPLRKRINGEKFITIKELKRSVSQPFYVL